jgi:hypothetical protein
VLVDALEASCGRCNHDPTACSHRPELFKLANGTVTDDQKVKALTVTDDQKVNAKRPNLSCQGMLQGDVLCQVAELPGCVRGQAGRRRAGGDRESQAGSLRRSRVLTAAHSGCRSDRWSHSTDRLLATGGGTAGG